LHQIQSTIFLQTRQKSFQQEARLNGLNCTKFNSELGSTHSLEGLGDGYVAGREGKGTPMVDKNTLQVHCILTKSDPNGRGTDLSEVSYWYYHGCGTFKWYIRSSASTSIRRPFFLQAITERPVSTVPWNLPRSSCVQPHNAVMLRPTVTHYHAQLFCSTNSELSRRSRELTSIAESTGEK